MRITHFGHACVLVETAGARLLLDPGTLSWGWTELRGLTAVLVTHHHDDHLDVERLTALLAADPGAALFADEESAAVLAPLPVQTVRPGERLELGGSVVEALGGAHAFVYEDFPACANLSYLIDRGAFFHPGDSFDDPGVAVDVLALPTSGPWLKVGDAITYLRALAPRVAVPVHEGALADTATHYAMLRAFAPAGTTFLPLEPGAPTSVPAPTG